MEEKQLLRTQIVGNIAVLTMDNPPLNLMTMHLLEELRKAVLTLPKDKQLRAIVLTAEGEHSFCAGFDTRHPSGMPKGGNGAYGQTVMNTVENCPLPIIAAINGYAFGGGLELALACDIRIAAEDAQLGLTEANLGLIAGWGGATRLPMIVGEGNAKYMIYTAARLSGQEAKEFGLVQKCVPRAQLMDTAMELAKVIASRAPMSITGSKKVIHASRQTNLGAGLITEMEQNTICASSKDVGEGVRALKEKRVPEFKNE